MIFYYWPSAHALTLTSIMPICVWQYVVALKYFRSLKTFRLTFLRMRNKCKIIDVQRNNKAFSV